MYEQVRLTNFKGFRDLTVGDLRRVTLVSGKNNTGKTALLEALFLHASGPLAAQNALATLQPLRGAPGLQFGSANAVSPWAHLFRNLDLSEPLELKAEVGGSEIQVTLRADKKSIGLEAPVVNQAPGSPLAGFQHRISIDVRQPGSQDDFYTQTISIPSSGQPFFLGQQGMTFPSFQLEPQASGPLQEAFFISGHAQSNHQVIANRFSNIRISGKDDLLVHVMREVEPRLKGLEVLVDAGQPTVFATFDSGRRLPLSLLGEGMSRIMELICTIVDQPKSLVLVDEIAEGVHWSVLSTLWLYVHEAARLSEVQLVATTHSKECLVSAWDVGNRTDREFSLLRLQIDEDEPHDVDVAHYDAEALEGALKMNVDIR